MKKWFPQALCSAVALMGLVWAVNASASTPEDYGLHIAKERKNRDKEWQDTIATMTMTLKNAKGRETVQELRLKTLEVDGDGDKGLTIFDNPRDVKGTAFLNYSHTNRPDDQWIFLPALKRVKRISSRNKSGPFMGSEFAYEDLSSFEVEKYDFTYLRDEQLDGMDMFVLQQIPTDKYSGYSKQIVWIDKALYRVYKVEFYDRKDSMLKVLTMSDYHQYLEKYWRAHTLLMENHQTGKSTVLRTSELTFKTGLEERDFSKAALNRAR